jgi:hypothetical protein
LTFTSTQLTMNKNLSKKSYTKENVNWNRMKKVEPQRKGILLDPDGTIVDSEGAYLEALNVALAAIGLEISSVDIKVAMEVPKRLEQGSPNRRSNQRN